MRDRRCSGPKRIGHVRILNSDRRATSPIQSNPLSQWPCFGWATDAQGRGSRVRKRGEPLNEHTGRYRRLRRRPFDPNPECVARSTLSGNRTRGDSG